MAAVALRVCTHAASKPSSVIGKAGSYIRPQERLTAGQKQKDRARTLCGFSKRDPLLRRQLTAAPPLFGLRQVHMAHFAVKVAARGQLEVARDGQSEALAARVKNSPKAWGSRRAPWQTPFQTGDRPGVRSTGEAENRDARGQPGGKVERRLYVALVPRLKRRLAQNRLDGLSGGEAFDAVLRSLAQRYDRADRQVEAFADAGGAGIGQTADARLSVREAQQRLVAVAHGCAAVRLPERRLRRFADAGRPGEEQRPTVGFSQAACRIARPRASSRLSIIIPDST